MLVSYSLAMRFIQYTPDTGRSKIFLSGAQGLQGERQMGMAQSGRDLGRADPCVGS